MGESMDTVTEIAARVIDMVECDIRRANPEVDAIATEKEGNTLLHGEAYYELENAIVEQLKELNSHKKKK